MQNGLSVSCAGAFLCGENDMNEPQVMALVAKVLGKWPSALIYQAFGHNSVTYEAVLPGRSVMVRMNENASAFAMTERNIATLAGLGLPVPVVLASDLSKIRYPFAYLLLDKIPGRDLRYELAGMTPAQMTRLAEQIVSFQRRVLTLPAGTGYGYVGIGEMGPHSSWWEIVLSVEAAQASRFEVYLRQVRPVCFLDDITVKNVIVQNGELQGLIDFDCVCYGDPLYWLALTTVGVVSDVGVAGQFYVQELKRLWKLTCEQEQVMAFYCTVLAQDFIRRHSSHETLEWKARMRNATEMWLAICAD
jgi:aminoglycoside phosphotransferase (APT) family kinase protein